MQKKGKMAALRLSYDISYIHLHVSKHKTPRLLPVTIQGAPDIRDATKRKPHPQAIPQKIDPNYTPDVKYSGRHLQRNRYCFQTYFGRLYLCGAVNGQPRFKWIKGELACFTNAVMCGKLWTVYWLWKNHAAVLERFIYEAVLLGNFGNVFVFVKFTYTFTLA